MSIYDLKSLHLPKLTGSLFKLFTAAVEMAVCMQQYKKHRNKQGAPVRLNLAIGEALTAMDYLQAQRMRTRAMNNFNKVFSEVDVILTPATAKIAQPFLTGGLKGGWTDLSLDTEMMRFIIPGILLGLPALSFPSGYDVRGLPIGMQTIGRHWEQNLLLRVAYNAEQVVERKLPKFYFS